MPRLFCFLIGACFLFSGVLAAQDLFPPKVTGVVKKIDLKVGTVTVRPSKGATEDETFSIRRKDIEVTTAAGEKTRLDVVAVGQTVQLKLGITGDVEAMVIQLPGFLATVVEVDAKTRKIEIAQEGTPSKTLPVAADARVSLAGRTAFLREVKPGSQMNVTASLDGKNVLALNLVWDPDGGKLANKLYPRIKTSRLPGMRIVGVVNDVDAGKGEIKLTGPKTKNVPKTMAVAKDAVIQLVYSQVAVQTLPLNQVAKLAQGTVMFSPETQQVTRMILQPPEVSAKIKSLDGDSGQLIVVLDKNEKTFALRRDFKVMDRTRVMRLADLQPNLAVNLVLSLDREQLLAVDIRQVN